MSRKPAFLHSISAQDARSLVAGGMAVFSIFALLSLVERPVAQALKATTPMPETAENRSAAPSSPASLVAVPLNAQRDTKGVLKAAPLPETPEEEAHARFIVRIKGVKEIERCVAIFRKDPGAARRIFRDWARHHPEVADFDLAGATYSGEVILTHPSRDGDVLDDARNRLLDMEGVRYADPDFIADPSDED